MSAVALLALLTIPVDFISIHHVVDRVPTWGGNYLRTGLYPTKGPTTTPVVLWRVFIGEVISSSPVSDSNGNIYVGSRDDHIYAISPSGRIKWKYDTGDDVDCTPTVWGSILYVTNDEGRLYAFDKESGKLLWKFGVDTYRGSPYVDADLIVTGGSSYLYAISHFHRLLWRIPLDGMVVYSPIAYYAPAGSFFVATSEGGVYAISRNGSVKWHTTLKGGNPSQSLAVSPDGIVYVPTYRSVVALDSNGRRLWKYPADSRNDEIRPYSVGVMPDGSVVVATRRGRVLRLTRHGRNLWTITLPKGRKDAVYSRVTIDSQGNVYVGTRGDRVYAISPSGTILFYIQRSRDVDSTPLLYGAGQLVVAGDDGTVEAYQSVH